MPTDVIEASADGEASADFEDDAERDSVAVAETDTDGAPECELAGE